MAKCTHVLRMHMLHNRAWQQMNQIIKTTVQCVQHSLEPQPSVCHATDQQIYRWSVGQDSPSRCALCPWDRPSWKSECNTRSAAELPIQCGQLGLSRGCWGAIQTVWWSSAPYTAATPWSTSFNVTAHRPAETRNGRQTSMGFEEKLYAGPTCKNITMELYTYKLLHTVCAKRAFCCMCQILLQPVTWYIVLLWRISGRRHRCSRVSL